MRALLLALALVACDAPSSPSKEVDAPLARQREMRATSGLELFDQPGGRVVATLPADTAPELLKRGGPGGTWCKVEHGGRSGWTPCTALDRARSGPAPITTPKEQAANETPRCATTCARAPLFREPPTITALDREVLEICPARSDASVARAEVRSFFARHVDDPRMQRALSASGRPGSGAGVRERNVDWLTGLWISTGPRNAFEHVFCGDEWDREDLGGLHWLPRYAQLEREGKLCYGGPVKRSARLGEQYLVRYAGLWPWSCGEKKVGGFPIDEDPIDIVALSTRAFVRCCERGGRDGGVYAAPDLGETRWRIWCGTRNGTYGIATVYPTDERATCAE